VFTTVAAVCITVYSVATVAYIVCITVYSVATVAYTVGTVDTPTEDSEDSNEGTQTRQEVTDSSLANAAVNGDYLLSLSLLKHLLVCYLHCTQLVAFTMLLLIKSCFVIFKR